VFGAPDRLSVLTCLLIAAIAVGVTIRDNTYVPWGTDSGAYMNQAQGWADGEIFAPASFLFWTPWSLDAMAESPLGYRPGPTRGTITGTYPLGYPILLAVALKTGGLLAEYLVAPLFIALLAWCAFVVGSTAGSGWAGVAASLLITACPVTLSHTLMPMSDVPATALWMLALVMTLRPGKGAAMAAGLATTLAILVRPNLAPLGAVLVIVLILSDAGWRNGILRALLYGVFAAIGPALVLWSQDVLYGSPFESGYVGAADFFRLERIPINARFYPSLLLDLYTPAVFAGVLMVPIALRRARRSAESFRAAVIAVAAVAIVLVNYALYLPYLTFDGWSWLRFMLPAMTMIFVLFAVLLDWCRVWIAGRSRIAATLMVVPLLALALQPRQELQMAFTGTEMFKRVQLMGGYLEAALPANAVILTYLHGGAVTIYTGRPIVRLDMIPPGGLDTVVDDLQRHAFRPYVVLDTATERGFFHDRFSPSKYVRLEWPARAEFMSTTLVTLHDFADRDRFLSGDRYPIDVLTWPGQSPYKGSWSLLHVPMEAVEMPPDPDTRMFIDAIDAKYRDALKRPALASHVDDDTSAMWVQRYLRFRIHGCAHPVAVDKIFQQIDGHGAQPLCSRPAKAVLPPWNETTEFRRELEIKLADRPPVATYVDLEGQAIWPQEYLRYRIEGCSHRDATAAVLARIDGEPDRPRCVSTAPRH
jgi:hypothetical protein